MTSSERITKRPRIFSDPAPNGLAELFGTPRNVNLFGESNSGGFYTLRLEHRDGGLAGCRSHKGEERFVLFRSDRPGAIAKVVFSLENESNKPNTNMMASTAKSVEGRIHVLDVKEPYRGRDLGGLLFSEAIQAMRIKRGQQVLTKSCCDENSDNAYNSSLWARVRCHLDAEEDVRRHNKLINFYERLGCHVKPNVKIRYLNNNDGETYRRIPMECDINGDLPDSSDKIDSLCNDSISFLPVQLRTVTGERISVQYGSGNSVTGAQSNSNTENNDGAQLLRRVEWVAVQTQRGLTFRTTLGMHLCAEPSGKVVADRRKADAWECFCIEPGFDSDDSDADAILEEEDDFRRKKLWKLKSHHGTYLYADPVSSMFALSKEPKFWQANDGNLTATPDTPLRRLHYRKAWIFQSYSYVQAMRDKFLGFENLPKMNIREALDLLQSVPCHPFRKGPSLRSFLFHTAEVFRKMGYPDWVQLIALVHELGRIHSLDEEKMMEKSYDWTISSRTRIVGCLPPERCIFSEFRRLSPDIKNDQYNSQLGIYRRHCGLENVFLLWTGPEYMYHMLKANDVTIPSDGLLLLRFFSLYDWHTNNAYSDLESENDNDIKFFIAEFDEIRRRARRTCVSDFSGDECERLWDTHYSHIFQKYSLVDKLKW
uniref:Inositol oxygenase n=1 Tax=Leptocylindrus danicus TaxID=163516 RepID=A0A7S2L9T4_9STRA|mmetsp:Transcript_33362/g.48281  ORF Transcript_33362/g.48281 Transcript_33362/m.48281 type:complete len:654 (+) Transcript_33362:272-2233(+)